MCAAPLLGGSGGGLRLGFALPPRTMGGVKRSRWAGSAAPVSSESTERPSELRESSDRGIREDAEAKDGDGPNSHEPDDDDFIARRRDWHESSLLLARASACCCPDSWTMSSPQRLVMDFIDCWDSNARSWL